ncbi:MAG: DUF6671 family protein [Dehalococcoidia bacterium]
MTAVMSPSRLRSRFAGRAAVVATMHGKERSLALPLRCGLGVDLRRGPGLDTDVLGTFTGEVPRPGPPAEVVLRKARMGCEAAGVTLAFASEGSFGPHPSAPFSLVHQELLACVDRDQGIEVIEPVVTLDTNMASVTVADVGALAERPYGRPSFLDRARFPSHALIVMPAAGRRIAPVKGIRDEVTLARAVAAAACASEDHLARVETDMRAHVNPTRRAVIRRLGLQLTKRLLTPCPACCSPGWGAVAVEYGLPCRACGTPTAHPRALVYRCTRCDAREERPREDGMTSASPGECSFCNP